MEQRAVATMPPVELLPVEQRAVETMLPVEETLAELGRGLEVSPPPPVKAVSSHVEKYYSAAGQAAATLLSIVVFQAYQAELLKELDVGEGITPEAVKELRQATDLVLRATKHTAQAVGHSMAGMVAVECHLWLNLTDIKEKEKSFLTDAPISKDGLFENSVRAPKQQSAVFRKHIPRWPREIERRQMLVACSRSSSSHCQRGALREESSPMAPLVRIGVLGLIHQLASTSGKRLDLSSTAKTSRPQAPSSSS